MSIKASRSADVAALIAALDSSDAVKRESAIARLAVIGARSVDRLVAAYPGGTRDTRVAILRTLEGMVDDRVVPLAREALGDGGEVAVAAASALRPLLQSTESRAATEALDVLVGTALDPSAQRRVRLAALEALREMPEAIRGPVAEVLQRDLGIETGRQDSPLTEAAWQDAVDGRLSDAPAALGEALHAHGDTAPLGTLQKLVDAVRTRENETRSETERAEWRQVRAAIHQALALRGSRVAVYDLRETIGAATAPLPAPFLAAVHAVGDQSCLEAIAAAWAAADSDEAWRHQLAAAFTAIVKREKLTRRSAAMKRIATRWPGLIP